MRKFPFDSCDARGSSMARRSNWSAHARRFLAHAGDLTKFQAGMRFLAQELIQIADLVKKKS